MENYVGMMVKLRIFNNGKFLIFTGEVLSVSDLHITFIDKFDDTYSFLKSEVFEISTKVDEVREK